MFRTARGFLLIAPPAFLAALAAFLLTHSRAAETFVPYPFLAEALGPSLARRPVGRFAVASALFFFIPYFVTGLLLLLSDAGLGAASNLWSSAGGKKAEPPARPRVPPEAMAALAGGAVVLSWFGGTALDRVAHGGELPGGVNVAPLLVAAIPFLATGFALALATVVAIPRALARLLSRREGKSPGPKGGRGTAAPARRQDGR